MVQHFPFDPKVGPQASGGFSVIDTVMGDSRENYLKKKEEIIKEAFAKAGYDNLTPEFIKKHCTIKQYHGDPLEYYYADNTFIISFSIMPELMFEGVNGTMVAKHSRF